MESILAKIFPPKMSIKIGFEDMVIAISHPEKYTIINTLPAHQQTCLIAGTTTIEKEETIINELLNKYDSTQKYIILYGKNSTDTSVDKKYQQLFALGIRDVYIYAGGIFEWLMLQDIYGKNGFPTMGVLGDMVLYRPQSIFANG